MQYEPEGAGRKRSRHRVRLRTPLISIPLRRGDHFAWRELPAERLLSFIAAHQLVDLAVKGPKRHERSHDDSVDQAWPEDDEVRRNRSPVGIQPVDHLVLTPRARVKEVRVRILVEPALRLGVQDDSR